MPVIMTSNVCQKWVLFNGATGTIVDVIFRHGEGPSADGTSWPHMVLVDFPKYSGPPVFKDGPNLVPVFPLKTEESGSVREMFAIKVGFCLTCHKAQGFTCGQSHVYDRVVVNLGPSSVETWGFGLGFVACSQCTCADNLAFEGDLTGSRVECIIKGKAVDKVRCVNTLHTSIQIFKYTHSVVWSDQVLKFLHIFCLGNVKVRIEDRRLMGLHDSTVH